MLEFSEFKLADNLKITQPLLPVTVSFLTSSAAAAKANFSWVKIGAAGYGTDASAGCCCQHILHFWRKIIRFLLRRLYVGVKAQRNKDAKLSKWWKNFDQMVNGWIIISYFLFQIIISIFEITLMTNHFKNVDRLGFRKCPCEQTDRIMYLVIARALDSVASSML